MKHKAVEGMLYVFRNINITFSAIIFYKSFCAYYLILANEAVTETIEFRVIEIQQKLYMFI